MRIFWILAVFLTFFSFCDSHAQKFFTREGSIQFFSRTDVEDIEAVNRKVAVVWDASSGAIEFSALMKAFEFKKALMQEHFNENYVESDKFPKATFKGILTGVGADQLTKDGTHPVSVKGTMTMHGVSQSVEAPGTVEVKDGKVKAQAVFSMKPADYAIVIPKVVENNIAKEVKVTVKLALEELKK
jgi:hypothetical protein